MRSTVALAGALLVLALAPAGSPALPTPVPPRDCNFMTVKGKRYNVKADQMRCQKARKIAKRVLTGRGAKGFTCQANPSDEIRYYCRKGNRYIFVNKR